MELYNDETYYSLLLMGKPRDAAAYLSRFPEKQELAQNLIAHMSSDISLARCEDSFVCALDAAYQRYYRRIFWQSWSYDTAGESLFADLLLLARDSTPKAHFQLKSNPTAVEKHGDLNQRLCCLEDLLAPLIEARGYHFLGGRTTGYFGPYIWKATTPETYQVNLPTGVQTYTVQMMDGFVSLSWLEFISLGELSTGGWQDGDSQMFCVANSYPKGKRNGSNFQISFLKHEAQHAWDKNHFPGLSPTMLEYRAKLVELIYYPELSKLFEFLSGADPDHRENVHTYSNYQVGHALSMMIFGNEFVVDQAQWQGKLAQVQASSHICLEHSLEVDWQ